MQDNSSDKGVVKFFGTAKNKKPIKIPVAVSLASFGVCGVMVVLAIVLSIALTNKYQFVEKGYGILRYKEVCSAVDIDEWNDLRVIAKGYSTPSKDSYIKKIVEKDKFTGDPNCVFIVLSYYVEEKNVDEAQRYLDVLGKLSSENKYASARIRNISAYNDISGQVELLKSISDGSGDDGYFMVGGPSGGSSVPAPAPEPQPLPEPEQPVREQGEK